VGGPALVGPLRKLRPSPLNQLVGAEGPGTGSLEELSTTSPSVLQGRAGAVRQGERMTTARPTPHLPQPVTERSRHDIVVVGGRVAGAATAMLLARMGHDVVVVERAEVLGDTLSTLGIARSGVVQLARWGLLDEVLATGAPPIRQVTFHAGGESVVRRIKDRAGVDHLVAPRRRVLDPTVAGAAARSGADVRYGITMTALRRDASGRVVGISACDGSGGTYELDARIVVGADGLRSRVARSVGARVVDQRHAAGATHYGFFRGPTWNGSEFFVGDGMFGGIFPTNDGEACIWVCSPTADAEAARRATGSPSGAFDLMVERAVPDLARRLAAAERTSNVSGVVRLPNQVRQAVGPGWALVGDAVYHRDAVTGHGISDAFRDAELLATSLDPFLRDEIDEVTALVGYERERADAAREIFEITCELSTYPPLATFGALQKRLSGAIEAEAAALAARPLPWARDLVAA
jgi:2-polyprenyl-6-methoxyphenol hydroxylase-like FAD-dependent oxidoreductase